MPPLKHYIILLTALLLTQSVYAQKNTAKKPVTNKPVTTVSKSAPSTKPKPGAIKPAVIEEDNKEPVDTFSVNGKFGFKTANNRVVLTPRYDNLFHGQRSVFYYAVQNGQYGIYNYLGKLIVPVEFDMIKDETRNYNYQFVTQKNGKWGAFDTLGNHLVPELYESVSPDSENKGIAIKNNGKWACADSAGKLLTDFLFDDIISRAVKSETYTAVAKNGKWGFLGADYKLAIDYKYDKVISNFYNGIACVSLNGVKGYINYEDNFNPQKDKVPAVLVLAKDKTATASNPATEELKKQDKEKDADKLFEVISKEHFKTITSMSKSNLETEKQQLAKNGLFFVDEATVMVYTDLSNKKAYGQSYKLEQGGIYSFRVIGVDIDKVSVMYGSKSINVPALEDDPYFAKITKPLQKGEGGICSYTLTITAKPGFTENLLIEVFGNSFLYAYIRRYKYKKH